MRKYDAMLDELQLKPSDHVLEIGCGWGACSIRAVQKFGCRWTGITISAEQFKIAQERVREHALDDKIDFKLLDYRFVLLSYRVHRGICEVFSSFEKFINAE